LVKLPVKNGKAILTQLLQANNRLSKTAKITKGRG
jgi:hypothetical protein